MFSLQYFTSRFTARCRLKLSLTFVKIWIVFSLGRQKLSSDSEWVDGFVAMFAFAGDISIYCYFINQSVTDRSFIWFRKSSMASRTMSYDLFLGTCLLIIVTNTGKSGPQSGTWQNKVVQAGRSTRGTWCTCTPIRAKSLLLLYF